MGGSIDTEKKEPVKLLVADDSLVFRRFIRDIFSASSEVVIVGEAQNGIAALDLVLKLRPDVIMMDMEMPVMDGMTALQHLMIHCPTPTIMVSSLSSEGTTRSLDALKNGAVGFIGKEELFSGTDVGIFSMEITAKIVNASQLVVDSVEPELQTEGLKEKTKPSNRVVFCEECGGRNVVEEFERTSHVICRFCHDKIDLELIEIHRRTSFITVLGGGEDAFRNLLNIIPRFDDALGGALLVVIKSRDTYLQTLAEYLDSVSTLRVVRASAGMEIEEGACYIASTDDLICIKPYSTTYTLSAVKRLEEGVGAVDLAMASAAMTFKRKAAGVLLSGSTEDGLKGMAALAKVTARRVLLHPSQCLSPYLVKAAIHANDGSVTIENEKALVDYLGTLYRAARQGQFT